MRFRLLAPLALGLAMSVLPAAAQTCPSEFCDSPISSLCDQGGFRLNFISFTPAAPADSGCSTTVYDVCSPLAGVCNGTARPGESCLDNDFCKKKGMNEDPTATCSRDCAVDQFRGLSHFDAFFPALGLECLTADAEVSGTCACTGPVPGCSVDGSIVLGDGSCFGPDSPLAKCDNTELPEGDCIRMTLEICGEQVGLGAGGAVVVSKESGDCNESCILGPSCQPCNPGPGGGGQCLTRTRGFWGTHPHLIQGDDPRSLELLPITVCGTAVTVTEHGVCSTSEGLCTNAKDRPSNPTYLALAAQLTAAKLNLQATAAVTGGGGSCSGFVSTRFPGKSIQQVIADCEGFCGAKKKDISDSGCIEALDEFNQSQDQGFAMDPEPFDHPGPALVDECQQARGNGIYVGPGGCSQP